MSNKNRSNLIILGIIVVAVIAIFAFLILLISQSGENDSNGTDTTTQLPTQVSSTNGNQTNSNTNGQNGDTSSDNNNNNTASNAERSPATITAEVATFEAQVNEALTPVDESSPIIMIPSQTPAYEGALPVAPPGTLVASETEEPEPDLLFNYIRYTQGPDIENPEIIIEIYGDGRVVQNGTEGTISEADIVTLDESISTLNFFGMQGNLISATRDSEDYFYRLTINKGSLQRSLLAQDGFMPNEFVQLLGLVRNAGNAITQRP